MTVLFQSSRVVSSIDNETEMEKFEVSALFAGFNNR